MPISKLLFGLLLLGGTILLGGMVWQVGSAGFLASCRALGFWIVPFFLLKAVPEALHAAGWAACFPGPLRHVRLWQLYLLQIAGSAINQVTPTATIGGDVAKVLLLESTLPRTQVTAAVFIDKASITLAQMCYLACGMVYVMGRLPLPTELQLILNLTIGLISAGLVGFIIVQRYGFLSKSVDKLRRLNIGKARLHWLSQRLAPLDAHLVAYYTVYPWRFVGSLSLHFLAFACGIPYTYILLRLLLGDSAPGLSEALMVAVVVAGLDQVFFLVPGRLGTLEGARFLTLSTLGVAQVYGLAFGLMGRLESLVWSGLGLLVYAIYPRLSRLQRPCKSVAGPLLHSPPRQTGGGN